MQESSLETIMGGKGVVLIVDDEILNLDLLDMMLKAAEYQPVRARDGAESLEKLTEFGMFDAILLDWMMPKMDGMELLKALKADPRYCDIPVIMQTAAGNPEKVQEALGAGAHSYLIKPYTDEAVINAVKEAQAYTKRKGQW